MKRTRKRRRVQLVIMAIGFLILGMTLFHVSAGQISAESDIDTITYKYYTNIYVERGDSLWSIAEAYITDEYRNVDAYIDEVKQINHIKGSQIDHGQYLCVPYYSSEHK